jgi:aminoglycoside phosphotransferase (APT) family kinase protein
MSMKHRDFHLCRNLVEDQRRHVVVELIDRALRAGRSEFLSLVGTSPQVDLVKADSESTLWRVLILSDRRSIAFLVRVFNTADAFRMAERESAVLKLLWDWGYPVPRLLDTFAGSEVFSQPFIVLEWIVGRPVRSHLLEDAIDAFGTARRVGKLLRSLHDLPLTTAEVPELLPRHTVGSDVITELAEGLTAADLFTDCREALAWLEEHRGAAPDGPPCFALVHGDFHPGNVLQRDDGALVVVDWTLAGWRNRWYDLGWAAVHMSPSAEDPMRRAMLDGYAGEDGLPADIPPVCEAFACLRGLANAAGLGRRGAAAMQRQRRPARIAFANALADRWKALTGIPPPYSPEECIAMERDVPASEPLGTDIPWT